MTSPWLPLLIAGAATLLGQSSAATHPARPDSAVPPVRRAAAPARVPSVWPDNEPAGLTRLVAADGSDKFYFAPRTNVFIGARWTDTVPRPASDGLPPVAVVADPASKYGHVIEKWYYAGEDDGWHGIYALQGPPGFGSPTGYRQLYFRMVARFSANWQWHVTNTQKLFYFGAQRNVGSPTQFFLSVSPNTVDFVDQSGDRATSGDYRCSARGLGITAGQYFTVELWIQANSASGAADGNARIWVNGTEITERLSALPSTWSYTGSSGLANRAWLDRPGRSTAFNGVQTFLYWGGSGDRKRVNDHFDVSEFYVSGQPF